MFDRSVVAIADMIASFCVTRLGPFAFPPPAKMTNSQHPLLFPCLHHPHQNHPHGSTKLRCWLLLVVQVDTEEIAACMDSANETADCIDFVGTH